MSNKIDLLTAFLCGFAFNLFLILGSVLACLLMFDLFSLTYMDKRIFIAFTGFIFITSLLVKLRKPFDDRFFNLLRSRYQKPFYLIVNEDSAAFSLNIATSDNKSKASTHPQIKHNESMTEYEFTLNTSFISPVGIFLKGFIKQDAKSLDKDPKKPLKSYPFSVFIPKFNGNKRAYRSLCRILIWHKDQNTLDLDFTS